MANVEANIIKFTHKLTKQLKKKIEIFREINFTRKILIEIVVVCNYILRVFPYGMRAKFTFNFTKFLKLIVLFFFCGFFIFLNFLFVITFRLRFFNFRKFFFLLHTFIFVNAKGLSHHGFNMV